MTLQTPDSLFCQARSCTERESQLVNLGKVRSRTPHVCSPWALPVVTGLAIESWAAMFASILTGTTVQHDDSRPVFVMAALLLAACQATVSSHQSCRGPTGLAGC